VIPELARAHVDLRASRVEDMRALERKFRALRPILPGAKLEIRWIQPSADGAEDERHALREGSRAVKRNGMTLGEAFVAADRMKFHRCAGRADA